MINVFMDFFVACILYWTYLPYKMVAGGGFEPPT